MTDKPKPNGWYRTIPKTNTGVFKRMGVPFGLCVNITFSCFFIGGWFDQYLTAIAIFLVSMFLARHVTEQDDRWWAILVDRLHTWLFRLVTNRFRSFKPFLDT